MNDFIGVYQMPRDITDAVLSLFKKFEHKSIPGETLNSDGIIGANPEIKDSSDLSFTKIPRHSQAPLIEYLHALNDCLEQYKEDYPLCNEGHAPWELIEDVNIQHYLPGQGFKKLHFEKNGGALVNRHLVFMTYLTDIPPECGGGTAFPQQDRVLPCVAGSTAIWPAEWTHSHRGVVSDTHEKVIVTGWYSYTS
jgi:prolyl 4-hydroxylase